MKLKLVLVLVIILLITGCSTLNFRKTSQPDISYVSPSPTKDTSLAMKEFTMNDGRLSVSLPEEWTMEDKSTEAGTILLWTSPDGDSIIGITHAVLNGVTKNSFIANYTGTIQNNLPEGITLTNKKVVIGGYEGEEYGLSGAYGDYLLPYMVVIVFENDNVYILTCAAQPENYSKFKDLFYDVQKSLAINDIE